MSFIGLGSLAVFQQGNYITNIVKVSLLVTLPGDSGLKGMW